MNRSIAENHSILAMRCLADAGNQLGVLLHADAKVLMNLNASRLSLLRFCGDTFSEKRFMQVQEKTVAPILLLLYVVFQ